MKFNLTSTMILVSQLNKNNKNSMIIMILVSQLNKNNKNYDTSIIVEQK